MPIYRLALDMRAGGMSTNKIADSLTARGVKTARGGSRAAATVKRMLESETAKSLA